MKKILRLIKIIYEPYNTLSELKDKPSPLLPFFAVIIVSMGLYALTFPFTYESILEILKKTANLPPNLKENAGKFYNFRWMYVGGMIRILIITPLKMLAQSGIFLILLPLVGATINFKYSLTGIAYANWISVIGNILKTPLIIAKKSYDVHTDMTLFLPSLNKGIFYNFLLNVDLFTIFSLFVLSTAFSVLGEMNRKAATLFVFSVWLVFIFLSSFLTIIIPGGR